MSYEEERQIPIRSTFSLLLVRLGDLSLAESSSIAKRSD
jgi:hypothetical protein